MGGTSKRKKEPSRAASDGDPAHGVNELEKSQAPETSVKTSALPLEIDISKAKGPFFKPSFDAFFDGDHGKIEDAMEYLARKALSGSARQSAASEELEKRQEMDQEKPSSSQAEAAVVVPKAGTRAEVSEVDLLRIRLWRARASHSRQAGLALVILSAAFFTGAFLTSALVFEVGSVSSFMFGVGLLAYEAEPRVKLFPSTSALIGPLKVVESELKQHGLFKAQAVFEKASPEGGAKEVMTFSGGFGDEGAPRYSIPPLGEGLVHAYELELGDLAKLDMDGAKVWLPRVMVDGLGLADRVRMKSSGNEVTTVIERPYVRALCVHDFMADGLCRVSGCPLTASVGQALARASGKPVTHRGCTYDAVSQKATLKDTVES